MTESRKNYKDGEDIVMSWGEVANLTHKTQVDLFNFCTCEDGPSVYEDCPREYPARRDPVWFRTEGKSIKYPRTKTDNN